MQHAEQLSATALDTNAPCPAASTQSAFESRLEAREQIRSLAALGGSAAPGG